MLKSPPIVLAVALMAGAMPTAHASIVLSSQVDVTVFNDYGASGSYGTALAQDGNIFFYTNHPSASLQNYQTSFTGLNSAGDSQTMDISASASAEAAAGVLKSSSSLTITNPYHNASNPAYVAMDFSIDPSGSPDSIEVDTQAKFADSLLVSAAGTLSSLNVYVTLDGSSTFGGGLGPDDAAYTQASIAVTNQSGQACVACGGGDFTGPGTFNQSFLLNIPVTDPNAVDLGVLLYMYNMFFLTSTYGYSESGDYTVSMDFSHTMQITGIQGLDSEGHTVALNSVTGSAGDYYPIAAVPIPAAAWLFPSALGLLGWVRRKSVTV